MTGIGNAPLPTFAAMFFGLLFAAYVQISRPMLSDLNKATGEVTDYEILNCPENNREDCLTIWLKSEEEPFYNRYSGDYKPFLKSDYRNREITIWYDSKREFNQIFSDGIVVIEYSWFLYWNLILVAIFLAIHLVSYYTAYKETTNINTYWSMWLYAFGAIKPIMKHNRRTYNPDDVLNLSRFDIIFVTRKKLQERMSGKVKTWILFFKLCDIRSMLPEVRSWLKRIPKGNEFLEGYDLYKTVVQSNASTEKIIETTDMIFDFLSRHMDEEREYYERLGRKFKDRFPTEYQNFIKEMDKIR